MIFVLYIFRISMITTVRKCRIWWHLHTTATITHSPPAPQIIAEGSSDLEFCLPVKNLMFSGKKIFPYLCLSLPFGSRRLSVPLKPRSKKFQKLILTNIVIRKVKRASFERRSTKLALVLPQTVAVWQRRDTDKT